MIIHEDHKKTDPSTTETCIVLFKYYIFCICFGFTLVFLHSQHKLYLEAEKYKQVPCDAESKHKVYNEKIPPDRP